MDVSFSNALELNKMSSTTAVIIWVMLSFLIVLITVTILVFRNQYASKVKIEMKPDKKSSLNPNSKGF